MPEVPAAPAVAPATPGPSSATPSDSKETKPAAPGAPPAKKKFQYKRDGQDVTEELGDAEIADRVRLGSTAFIRMQEAADARKEKAALQARLKNRSDLEALIKESGHDLDALAEDIVAKKYAPQFMKEEERRVYDAEQKRLAAEDQLKGYKQKEEQQRLTQEQQRFMQLLDARLGELSKVDLGGYQVPKVPRMAARAAEIWESDHEVGYSRPPEETAKLLVESLAADVQAARGKAKGRDLVLFAKRLFGEDFIRELRTADIEEVKSRRAAGAPAEEGRARVLTNGASTKRPKQAGGSFDDQWSKRFGV